MTATSLASARHSIVSHSPIRVRLLTLAAAIAIWPTWGPLLSTWLNTADYQHGPMVLVVSAVWLWIAARRTGGTAASGDWKAAVLLGLFACTWLIAFRSSVESGKQLLAPLVLWLAVCAGVGWRQALTVAAPIFYLYFAIPVWELLVPLLQALTVLVSRTVLGLMGIPVRIDGLLVTIPEGSFIVEEGCSGKRYLVVILAIASLLAFVLGMTRRRALLYIAGAGGLALVANWIRVIIIIYAGHATHMQHYWVAREHISLGWGIFAVLLLVVCIIGKLLAAPVERGAQTAPTVEPSLASSLAATPSLVRTVAILAFVPLAMAYASYLDFAGRLPPTDPAATVVTGWRGPLPPSGAWAPEYHEASRYFHGAYQSQDGLEVEAYTATYGSQSAGAKLINYYNRITPPRWLVISRQLTTRVRSGTRNLSVATLKTRAPDGGIWLIDSFYEVAGVATPLDSGAQLLFGTRSWTGPAPSSVVAVATRCFEGNCDAARTQLDAFWKAGSFAAVGKSYVRANATPARRPVSD